MVVELIIVLGISIFWLLFHSLIVSIADKNTGEGIFFADGKIKSNHYHLQKSKFLFLFIFLINRKWKKGLISKFSFWAIVISCVYILVAIIIEIVCFCFDWILRLTMPTLFIGLWVIFPIIITWLSAIIIHVKQKKK